MRIASLGLGHVKSFRDNYLALATTAALLFISVFCHGQINVDTTKPLQKQSSYGFDYNILDTRTGLGLPKDTVKFALKDSGRIAYMNRNIYAYDGSVWNLASGLGNGSGVDSTNMNPDSTILYVFNHDGTIDSYEYQSDTLLFTPTAIPYALASGVLGDDVSGLSYDGTNISVGHNNPGALSGLQINGGRAAIYGHLNGMVLNVGAGLAGGGVYDATKAFTFQNRGNTLLHLYTLGPGPYTQWADFATIIRSTSLSTLGTTLTTSGTVKPLVSDANGQISNGLPMGKGTLSAGTVIISDPAVRITSIIQITRNTPAGTLGHLSAPEASIINGTSFVVNSSSNTETSTFYYTILNP